MEALGNSFNNKDGYIELESELFDKKVIVTWCVGHLIQLAHMEDYDSNLKQWSKDTLPFIPEDFILKYLTMVVNNLKSSKNYAKI